MPSATARSEDLRPVELDARHVSGGVALDAEAGWNQNAADWRLMLGFGEGFGLEAPDGTLVASTVILPYGPRVAWISMVLVTRAWRRRGLATRLLTEAIDRVRASRRAALLDATPDGERVYRQHGFRPLFRFHRYRGRAAGRDSVPGGVRRLTPADRSAIAAYDRVVFGADRAPVLTDLAARSAGAAFRCAGPPRGYVLSRDGRFARQIGPLCAEDDAGALALLGHALANARGPLLIDVPDHQPALRAAIARHGFRPVRPFTRMVRGPRAPLGDPRRCYAVAGPELG
jgi:GNAT superfamily N-acetyltransferase